MHCLLRRIVLEPAIRLADEDWIANPSNLHPNWNQCHQNRRIVYSILGEIFPEFEFRNLFWFIFLDRLPAEALATNRAGNAQHLQIFRFRFWASNVCIRLRPALTPRCREGGLVVRQWSATLFSCWSILRGIGLLSTSGSS